MLVLLCGGVCFYPIRLEAARAGEFGYSVLSETQIRDLINGKPFENYAEVKFLMSDGSDMRVAMTKDEKVNLKESDYPEIMKGVIRGWEQEMSTKQWQQERVIKYKLKFFNLTIVERIE